MKKIEFAPDPARLAVDQRAVKGDTRTSGDAEVILVSRLVGSTKSLVKQARTLDILGRKRRPCFDAGPIALALDTEHPIAILVVAANLAAGDSAGAIRFTKTVAHRRTAAVHADVAAGPAEYRSRHDRSGLVFHRKIGGQDRA